MGRKESEDYIPAMGSKRLSALYDPFVRWTVRDTTLKRRLMAQARLQNGHHVLDLGCGTGTLAIMIKKEYPGTAVTAIDADPRILDIARTKVSKAGTDIALDRGMAYDLPYPESSFDRVVSTLVFHHLTHNQKLRAFKEAFRVLRRGGELHFADFGEPDGPLMWLVSLATRRLERAEDNICGFLPLMMAAAGFEQIAECVRHSTMFGSVSLCQARKASSA